MVGPMKKKVITTTIITFVITVLILGVIGFIIFSNLNSRITELTNKGTYEQRYVFKEDMIVGQTITKDDIQLVDVVKAGIPEDSYALKTKTTTSLGEEKEVNSDTLLIGRVVKANAKKNTIITDSVLYERDGISSIDERLQEFNMILLPSDLVENDYVDVRILFPTGEDYSVLVGKKVEKYSNDTIFMKLTENEILTMGSAIVEAYIIDGTKLYANKYIDPDTQLNDYNKVDYVAKYNSIINQMLQDSITTDEEGVQTQTLTEDELSIETVATALGVTVKETEEIKKAAHGDEALKKIYEDKLVITKKSIKMTYPVKEDVLALIKSNPNILDEVKANFDTDAIIAQRKEMLDSSVGQYVEGYGFIANQDNLDKIVENLATEVATQKEERRAYLQSLIEKQ